MADLTGFSIYNVLPYFGFGKEPQNLLFHLCKITRNLHLTFKDTIYEDVSTLYKFSEDKIYEDVWEVENFKATSKTGKLSRILILPAISEKNEVQLSIRKAYSKDFYWYVGITKNLEPSPKGLGDK